MLIEGFYFLCRAYFYIEVISRLIKVSSEAMVHVYLIYIH